jgi:hypothetical protein
MTDLTDSEYSILDELYFVTSFAALHQALTMNKRELLQGLASLLDRGLVTQLIFDPVVNDFQKLEVPEPATLEQSSFVASKKGLLLHNSR